MKVNTVDKKSLVENRQSELMSRCLVIIKRNEEEHFIKKSQNLIQ